MITPLWTMSSKKPSNNSTIDNQLKLASADRRPGAGGEWCWRVYALGRSLQGPVGRRAHR